MVTRILLLVTTGLALIPHSALAQQQTLSVDPAQSKVLFTLTDSVHGVHGAFRIETGSVVFNRRDGAMSGAIAVDARSGDSGNGSRDKRMTNDELKAPAFSTVTFAPRHYSGTLAATGDSSIVVDGTFTLLGTPHEISVPMQVHFDGAQCQAKGSFVVPYVKWGMKDPSNFMMHVGKEVTVDLVLAGSVVPAKPE